MRHSLLSFISKWFAVVKTRHFPNQKHGGLLKQQGETAAFARPRDIDLLDLMFWAANAGNRGGNETMVLKEIEMPPSHLLEIMGMTELAADRTGEKRTAPGSYREPQFVRAFWMCRAVAW